MFRFAAHPLETMSLPRYAPLAPLAATSSSGAGHGSHADCFHRSFSPEEQLSLLEEDWSAQTRVSVILGSLVAAGMMLGIISVVIVFWLYG